MRAAGSGSARQRDELTRVGAVAARVAAAETKGGPKGEGMVPASQHVQEVRFLNGARVADGLPGPGCVWVRQGRRGWARCVHSCTRTEERASVRSLSRRVGARAELRAGRTPPRMGQFLAGEIGRLKDKLALAERAPGIVRR